MSGEPLTTTTAAIILGGGTGERLGGAIKADLALGGRRFLGILITELRAQPQIGEIVVVAPPEVTVPDGILQTLEEPAGGGPVAGVIAGLDALRSPVSAVVVLTVDAPFAARAVPALMAGLGHGTDDGEAGPRHGTGDGVAGLGHGTGDGVASLGGAVSDGAAARGEAGFTEYLLAIYRTDALRRRAAEYAIRDVSARRFFSALQPTEVEVPPLALRDVDTPEDLARLSVIAEIQLVQDVGNEWTHHLHRVPDPTRGTRSADHQS